jgi:hypothetical protein
MATTRSHLQRRAAMSRLKQASPQQLDRVIADSVQSRAHEINGAFFGVGAPGLNRLLFYRQKTDLDIPPYGYGGRATALRRVFRLVGADVIASAIAVLIQKVQATAYVIEGPERTVRQAQQMIDLADLGKGWLQYVAKWVLDYCTQDNGAFTEILGPGKALRRNGQVVRNLDGTPVVDVAQPLAARALSFAHIDSIACERTGVYELPVRYYDINGSMHLLNNTRVHWVADMPQADERLFGYGFCGLSRCLSMVQYAVNWATARNESLDNMPPLSIMALENINKEVFEKQMLAYEGERQAVEETVLRSLLTLVQQDPTKPIGVKLTPVRQLWESFDEESAFRLIVNTVAMAFGLDPQDLAPLTSQAMGSGMQSTVLEDKARGKGHGTILTQLEEFMRGALPASCSFGFDFQDDQQDELRARIRESKINGIVKLAQPLVQRLPNVQDPLADLTASSPIEAIINRDEAKQLLMLEIPEYADVLDPSRTLRDQVVVDDMDPTLVEMQMKMYGPRARYHSKSRQTVILGSERFQKKTAKRVVVDPVTDADVQEAEQWLTDLGIDLTKLRPEQQEAALASA